MNGTDRVIESKKREMIEFQESRLWWLAVVVIILLAATLYATDTVNTPGGWWLVPNIEFAVNTLWMRLILLAAAVTICVYFRNSAKRLRRENHELIENLTQYGCQLEKKNHQISRLKDLSDQLIGVTNLQTALELVLDAMVDEMGPDTASIMLRDTSDETYRILASHGLSPEVVQSTRIRLGEAIAGRVVQEGKPMILNSDDLSKDMERRAHRKDTIGSSLIVPVKLEDDVRGVVSVAKRVGTCRFTEEDMAVLSSVASQVSVIIQKTELLDSLSNQVETLASTVRELQHARAGLVQSEKLASVGRLAGGLAHEIRNPLQVILGWVELLLAAETDEYKAKRLDGVLDHTKRIAEIISSLLSFSRQTAETEFTDVDVNSVLKKTLHLVEPQVAIHDITVRKEFREKLPVILGSESQLQQVFTNLALNAYQAMRAKGGGMLTVRTSPGPTEVEVEFEDTGPGIPEEHLDHIFEPFFSTKPEGEGTGLGLSIAYGIVESHGGSIKVQTSEGQGARFTVSLPVLEKAA